MGTAWPQKYHSSRGHARAILAQNKTFSHVALANATTRHTIAEPSVQYRRPPSPKPSKATATAAFPRRISSNSEHNGSIGAAGVDLPDGPVDDRSSDARLAQSTCVDSDAASTGEVYPVAAQLPSDLWWLLLAKAIFSTLNIPGQHCWSRPPSEGWRLDTAGDQEGIKALQRRSYAAAKITTTTTTTMNASNQVTLNRFIRLTVTLLITRTLLLRRLVLATAAIVALLSDRNPTNKMKQPNAAIVIISSVPRRRRSRCRLRSSWPRPYDYSNCCWSSSCRHPLPCSAAIATATATTAVAIISHSVPRRQHCDDLNEAESYGLQKWLVVNNSQNSQVAVAVMKIVATKTAPETNGCSDEEVVDEDPNVQCGRTVQTVRRSQPAVFRKWFDCSCQHCSLLTCSRFSMESVIKRSCPGAEVPPMELLARRCLPTRRTTRASVCTSS